MKQLIIAMAVMVYGLAQANPVADLKLVGQSELSWMFWKIYDIQLLSSDGQFDREKYPLALVIRYARDIPSDQLLESTLDEWSRQEIAWKPQWENKLDELWPDVSPGDEITLRVDRERNSHFFFNNELLGSIQDSEFAPAFLAIWLSENSLKPRLKRQLTGTF